ncbi:zf-HC2 domain-containing protein [Streptomyces sp. NPDC056361]|uniref:zf-HC2 domain-containing protein n=1 Tax=Streptomyces sp. NPDC056361 TaxID=3345795 RepID=UPI0035D55670
MSGTRPSSPTPAEHHLGDRLAALVDGELGHDARERVLAHLATCPRCKAEADAQRTLKSVFASAAPPPLSEGFLARLQGLPGEPPGGSGGPRGPLEELLAGGVKSDGFATAAVVTPGQGTAGGTGFRIHDVGDRAGTSGRGRRFAFAAASAVSFAAIALGGTLPMDTSVSAGARGGQGTGSAVTPLRASGTTGGGGSTSPSSRGTRSGERYGAQSVDTGALTPQAPAGVPHGPVAAAPPGAVAPGAVRVDAAPLVAVGVRNPATQSLLALSPFVRPTAPALRLAFAPDPATGPTSTAVPLVARR